MLTEGQKAGVKFSESEGFWPAFLRFSYLHKCDIIVKKVQLLKSKEKKP